MTTRTFRQLAQGFGSTPGSISVSLDGNVIYNGPISTLDEPVTINNISNIAFAWTADVAYAGTQTLSVTATDATVVLGRSIANYSNIKTFNVNQQDTYIPWTDTGFDIFYKDPITGIVDPKSNVQIDGVPLTPSRAPDQMGQWHWVLNPGETLTCTITVQAGTEATILDPARLYGSNEIVIDGGVTYVSTPSSGRTAGIPLTDRRFWQPLPIPPHDPNAIYSLNDRCYVGDQVWMAAQTPTPGTVPFTDGSYWWGPWGAATV